MRSDFFYDSKGAGRIHACRWMPEQTPVAVVQIVHGIAEFIERYDGFASFLNTMGILVVAEDHMGHGQSINGDGIRGYFHGGWFTAVEDSYALLKMTREEYPDVPYILFGHSMGSFMARTMLCKYPDAGLSAAIICGTGWQPRQMLPAAIKLCEIVCKRTGESNPSPMLQNLIFGSYNQKVEHPRTDYDWLSRDPKTVDAYIAHPLCGFIPSCGLLRDMLKGIRFVEDPEQLKCMNRSLPVLFIAGGNDPVGSYGKGVLQAAEAFRKTGMSDVKAKLYPLCRHEILNEINRTDIYADVAAWICEKTGISQKEY